MWQRSPLKYGVDLQIVDTCMDRYPTSPAEDVKALLAIQKQLAGEAEGAAALDEAARLKLQRKQLATMVGGLGDWGWMGWGFSAGQD